MATNLALDPELLDQVVEWRPSRHHRRLAHSALRRYELTLLSVDEDFANAALHVPFKLWGNG